MAKKSKNLNLRNIKFKFSGDLTPPAPPPPPSQASDVIVAKFEASLQTERSTRIVSLVVTFTEILPRYRRTGSTADKPVASVTEIEDIVRVLLQPIFPAQKGIRLLGVTLSSLEQAAEGPADDRQFALPLA